MDVTEKLGDRYRLVELLDVGGTSQVWRAHDEVLDRSVAVKMLSTDRAPDKSFREAIRAEARAAASLSHPHITHVHDYGETLDDSGAAVPYVVMELLNGPTLAERLRRGPLPVADALRIGAEVAEALTAAHRLGIVHRDVKPANIVLTPAGAKVVDFGIAAPAGHEAELGATGEIWGTPGYLAPERLLGREVMTASDVYALGLLVYHMLTGQLPWPAETTTEILTAHISVEPSPLPAIDGVPAGVVAACRRCLAKDPARRPGAAQMAEVLGAAGLPRRRRAMDARTRRGVLVVAALLVAFGLGGALPSAHGASVPTQGGQAAAPGDTPTSPAPPVSPTTNATGAGGGGPAGRVPVSGLAGDRTGGAQASPAPVRTNATTSSRPKPKPVQRTISTVGGSIVARCVGSTASIVSTSPLTGFAVADLNAGPAKQVGLTFHALVTDVNVVITCSSGVPTPSISVS